MWSFSWLVSFSLTQSPVQSFALNEWVVAEALGRSALPGGFLTLRGKSQGVPRGIRIGGSGEGRGGGPVAGWPCQPPTSGPAVHTEPGNSGLAGRSGPGRSWPSRPPRTRRHRPAGPDHTRPLPRASVFLMGTDVCRGSGWSGQVGPHNAPVVHSRWAVWGGAV